MVHARGDMFHTRHSHSRGESSSRWTRYKRGYTHMDGTDEQRSSIRIRDAANAVYYHSSMDHFGSEHSEQYLIPYIKRGQGHEVLPN